jgi:class 3 adenylate cyclase
MKPRDDLPAGEVTLVFTDIEGSTRLLHLLGDRYAGALSEHRRLLREAFVAHSGVEVNTWGDALFTVFRDAASALLATAHAQRSLALH